jgi:hypothetical protein
VIRQRCREGDLDSHGVVLVVAGGGWGGPRCSRTAAASVSSRRARARAPGHGKNGV